MNKKSIIQISIIIAIIVLLPLAGKNLQDLYSFLNEKSQNKTNLFYFFYGGGSIVGYFLPLIIELVKKGIARRLLIIFIVNLFFGWTFVGWVIALQMALDKYK